MLFMLVKRRFEEIGWIANAIEIVGGLISIVFAASLQDYPIFRLLLVVLAFGLFWHPIHCKIKKERSRKETQKLHMKLIGLPQLDQKVLGRREHISEATRKLAPGKYLAICGPGGIGKTTLANEIVREIAQKRPEIFKDGAFFHSFYNQPSIDAAFRSLAHLLKIPPGEKLPIREKLKIALADKQLLLFFDGAEVADDLPSLLEIAGTCGILVTSRNRADASIWRIDLDVLSDRDAYQLLQMWAGRGINSRVGNAICEKVGNLPLAIKLAGHYLSTTGETDQTYLEWLIQSPLEALNRGNRQRDSVPVLLTKSLEQLRPEAIDILRIFGFLSPAPVHTDWISRLSGKDRSECSVIVGHLVQFGFICADGDHRQVSHALIHTYVSKMLSASDETVIAAAGALSELIGSAEKPISSLPISRHQALHIFEMLRSLLERQMLENFFELSSLVFESLLFLGYISDLEDFYMLLLEQQSGKSPAQQRLIRGCLINIYNNSERFNEAIRLAWQNHDENWSRSRDYFWLANDLCNLGISHASLGNNLRSKRFFWECINTYEAIKPNVTPDLAAKIEALIMRAKGNLAIALRKLGEWDEAFATTTVVLSSGICSESSLAVCYENLGQLHLDSDSPYYNLNKAIECFQHARKYNGDAHNSLGCAIQDENLGAAFFGNGQIDLSIQAFRCAREFYSSINWTRKYEEIQRKILEVSGAHPKHVAVVPQESKALRRNISLRITFNSPSITLKCHIQPETGFGVTH